MASLFILLSFISTQVSPLLLLCTHILLSGLIVFPGWFTHDCFSLSFCVLWLWRFVLLIHQVMSRRTSLRRAPVLARVQSFLVWVEKPEEKKIRIGPYKPHLLKLG